MGVFATRSPFRPNNLGLSSVKLIGLEETREYGTVIHVAGADLMDGTPIFDIKPYLPYTDAHPEASCGFALMETPLTVDCPEVLLARVPAEKRQGLLSALAQDPRPAYQNDPERVYCMPFGGYTISFTVSGTVLTVRDVSPGE